jgi:hypothetical protein
MCLVLISGLLPIWLGAHACSDDLTAWGGVQLQSAAKPSDTNLRQLSLEALTANKVSFES